MQVHLRVPSIHPDALATPRTQQRRCRSARCGHCVLRARNVGVYCFHCEYRRQATRAEWMRRHPAVSVE